MANTQNTNDLWSKILLLESKLIETEKNLNKLDSYLVDMHRKIDKIKDDLREFKNLPDIENRVREVEIEIDSVKLELPEIRLVKKLFLGMVAFLLTAFLGLIWNALITNPNKINSVPPDKLNDITKKFIEEYQRGSNK